MLWELLKVGNEMLQINSLRNVSERVDLIEDLL